MPDYRVRPVRPGDAAIVAHHRVRMFQDMGSASAADGPPLAAATRDQLEPLIASGEYFGWLMEADGEAFLAAQGWSYVAVAPDGTLRRPVT